MQAIFICISVKLNAQHIEEKKSYQTNKNRHHYYEGELFITQCQTLNLSDLGLDFQAKKVAKKKKKRYNPRPTELTSHSSLTTSFTLL